MTQANINVAPHRDDGRPPNRLEALKRSARGARSAGLAVLPPAEDGTKRPGPGRWGEYQTRLASDAEFEEWYGPRSRGTGLGLVTGSVSGKAKGTGWSLVCLDFDDEAAYLAFVELARAAGLGPLLDRIEDAFLERTPKGGRHWLVYAEMVGGEVWPSTKLAQKPDPSDPRKRSTLAETKGEGGFVIVSPTFGKVHPSGKPYELLKGGFATIAAVTADEFRSLLDLAATLDESVAPAPVQPAPPAGHAAVGGEVTPWDDFNGRATWPEVLFGWSVVYVKDGVTHWRRPGKSEGTSATTNRGGTDHLMVFSSSTEFESVLGPARASYSKFSAYAILSHGGDHKKAIEDLRQRGYGSSAVWVEKAGRWVEEVLPNPVAYGPTIRLRKPGEGPPRARLKTKPTALPTTDVRTVADPERTSALDARLAAYPCTDLGNAERLVARHGADLRYCHPWGKFLCFDSRRWKPDDTGEVRRRAKDVSRSVLREAALVADDDARKALTKWAFASEKRDRLNAMLSLAEAEKGIPVLPDALDSDPWAFNCLNGTVDLRTGILRPHRREDLITKLCPVEFDPTAECPLWLATLAKFFARDDPARQAELVGYWSRVCGYALTGVIRDHVLPVAYGAGSNGKSTILGALMDVMGPDYAMKASPDMFMAKRGETHPTDRADLFGKRLVVAIETEADRRLNESMIKEVTGGDRIRARRMREDFWEFAPTHTILMATNHKPVIRGTDNGIWRRLKLIPFTVTMPDAQADKSMPEKLRAEAAGILAWCVRGCLEWQARGLDEPEEVKLATAGYRAEQDLIGAFLEECAIVASGIRVKASELYQRYKSWAEAANERTMSLTAFGNAMRERGVEVSKTNYVWYIGIGMKPAYDEVEAPRETGVM